MEKFGIFMARLIMHVAGTVLVGMVLSILWSWFIAPVFDVKDLRLIEAIGICFVLGYLLHKRDKSKEDDSIKESFDDFLYRIVLSLLVLGVSWIYHLFI